VFEEIIFSKIAVNRARKFIDKAYFLNIPSIPSSRAASPRGKNMKTNAKRSSIAGKTERIKAVRTKNETVEGLEHKLIRPINR
jgi:hypothetical protein